MGKCGVYGGGKSVVNIIYFRFVDVDVAMCRISPFVLSAQHEILNCVARFVCRTPRELAERENQMNPLKSFFSAVIYSTYGWF